MKQFAESHGRTPALLQPLREPSFLAIWSASLLSNSGQLIQGVGAAWAMVHLTDLPYMVALVQTAGFLPLMLLSIPAGAMADKLDGRRVALFGLIFALLSAAGLTIVTLCGELNAWSLLGFSLLVGTGAAIFAPAWQASIGEHVEPAHLPSAVALNSVSYNLARSIGPAIGGAIVLTAGTAATFGINALAYLPIICAFWYWKRKPARSPLPTERVDRAILGGIRYAMHSPPILAVVVRTLATSLTGASILALAPLVAKDLLQGGAGEYGWLLCAYGFGAVCGATQISRIRARLPVETTVRWLALIGGAAVAAIGASHTLPYTLTAYFILGGIWMVQNAQFNVGVQLSAPGWVTARALACWTTALAAGMAVGAWLWGQVASELGIRDAYLFSGIFLALSTLIGLWLPLPKAIASKPEMSALREHPDTSLDIGVSSGPIVIEIEYCVAEENAHAFFVAMHKGTRRARLRSGAFDWSLARDIANPQSWTERFHCPTWGDYLLQRNRMTQADRDAEAIVQTFHVGNPDGRVRRRLEYDMGSGFHGNDGSRSDSERRMG